MSPRVLDMKGPHAHVYERPAPDGNGRQVVKESIPDENLHSPAILPDQSRSAVRNEALALIYLAQHTTVPVPTVIEFMDEPGYPVRLVTEFVENALPPKDLRIPLHAINDPDCRSFSGSPLFGLRLEETHVSIQDWKYRRYDLNSPYVLCHGDLGWHNLLLDPKTFEIKAIVDWEYAGFYPVEGESEFWRRKGPIIFRRGIETCDIDHVIKVLSDHRVVESPSEALILESGSSGSRLRQLQRHFYVPDDQTISVGTIHSQGAMTSRQLIATSLNDLASHFQADNMARDAIIAQVITYVDVNPPGKLRSISQDYGSISDLSDLLPQAFTTLADRLEPSGHSFLPLRDHFSAQAEAQERLFEREKSKPLPGTEEWKEETELRAKSREMKTESRNIADQALRDSEVKKWKAIKEFAHSLLRLSSAAESLFPYLPDHDQGHTPPQADLEHAFAEYRTEDVSSKGGSGGWAVKVEDDEDVIQHMRDAHLKVWEGKKAERDEWMTFKEKGGERGMREWEVEDKMRMKEREKLRMRAQAKGEKAGPSQ